jgi:hypothetical protein
VRGVGVSRQFGDRQRVRLLAAAFAERMSAADVDRRSTPQIGQSEVGASIATETRAEQRKQRLVLVDRHELAVAHRPAFRRKRERHDPDFGQERFRHRALLFGGEPARTGRFCFRLDLKRRPLVYGVERFLFGRHST